MQQNKKEHPKLKEGLHPKNRHRERYDFKKLIATCPELKQFVSINQYGDESVDFFDPKAVKTLNKALLMHHYGLTYWDIPEQYLCPPIPGRAEYIHRVADLLSENNNGQVPEGKNIHCLDIGVGANCIYPLIGHQEYGWKFTGSEIDPVAIESARKIIEANDSLKDDIEIRLQKDPKKIFSGIIKDGEKFDLTICNPPFHSSQHEADAGSRRKLKNLKGKDDHKQVLNFSGKSHELWTEGGEERFIAAMIRESKVFSKNCLWFTTLVSKEETLDTIFQSLKFENASDVKTITMKFGNKTSRIVAWTFLNKEGQIK